MQKAIFWFVGERMKKTIVTLIAMLSLLNLSPLNFAKGFGVGGSLNYYAVTDSIFKDIYGPGNIMFGCSLSYELIHKAELRAEVNYFRDRGEMSISQEEITMNIIPIVLGIRIRIKDIKSYSPYVGAGICFYSYREELPERFEDVSESTIGFHVEVGSYVDITHRFFLDLNVRYINAADKPFDETIKLGGFRAGIGIGYSF